MYALTSAVVSNLVVCCLAYHAKLLLPDLFLRAFIGGSGTDAGVAFVFVFTLIDITVMKDRLCVDIDSFDRRNKTGFVRSSIVSIPEKIAETLRIRT